MQSVSSTNGRAFKVGWSLILIVGIVATILGIALLIPTLDPGAEAFMGKSLSEIRTFSPRVADWIWHENKESIFAFTLLGASIFLITWNALRRGERWAWYTLVLLTVGYDLMYIGIHAPIGYLTYIPVAVILLIVFLVGAVLTAKTVFQSKR